MSAGSPPRPCDWCGQPLVVVWVHGHGQCARCGTNLAPCCEGGETCPAPAVQAANAPPRALSSPPRRSPTSGFSE